MNTISVAIITDNEAEILPFTLECLIPLVEVDLLNRVVVVDSFSTDGTQELAKSFGDKLPIEVYERQFDNFRDQKNFALDKCSGTWVLGLDADMLITSLTFRHLFMSGFFDKRQVWDFSLYYARGDFKNYCTLSTTKMPTTRLWKNTGLRYEREIHEYLVLPGGRGWDSIHNAHTIESTERVAIVETSLLKSEKYLKMRTERYKKWDKQSSDAGIPIHKMEDNSRELMENRSSFTLPMPQVVVDGVPEKILNSVPPYLV